jgi:hypothetical protein
LGAAEPELEFALDGRGAWPLLQGCLAAAFVKLNGETRSEKLNLPRHSAGFNFFSTHETQANLRHALPVKYMQLLTVPDSRRDAMRDR